TGEGGGPALHRSLLEGLLGVAGAAHPRGNPRLERLGLGAGPAHPWRGRGRRGRGGGRLNGGSRDGGRAIRGLEQLADHVVVAAGEALGDQGRAGAADQVHRGQRRPAGLGGGALLTEGADAEVVVGGEGAERLADLGGGGRGLRAPAEVGERHRDGGGDLVGRACAMPGGRHERSPSGEWRPRKRVPRALSTHGAWAGGTRGASGGPQAVLQCLRLRVRDGEGALKMGIARCPDARWGSEQGEPARGGSLFPPIQTDPVARNPGAAPEVCQDAMDQTAQDRDEVLSRYMAEHGLKNTRQRNIIIDTFFNLKGHLSVEELWSEVRAQDARISVATVYRTMKLLHDCGLAHAR